MSQIDPTLRQEVETLVENSKTLLERLKRAEQANGEIITLLAQERDNSANLLKRSNLKEVEIRQLCSQLKIAQQTIGSLRAELSQSYLTNQTFHRRTQQIEGRERRKAENARKTVRVLRKLIEEQNKNYAELQDRYRRLLDATNSFKAASPVSKIED